MIPTQLTKLALVDGTNQININFNNIAIKCNIKQLIHMHYTYVFEQLLKIT